MPNFVWLAKDPRGESALLEVTAPTAEAARQSLVSQGYTDLVLKEDEIMDATRAGFPEKTMFLGEEIKVTAEGRLKGRERAPATFGRVLVESFFRDRGFSLVLLISVVLLWWLGHTTAAIVAAMVLLGWKIFMLCVALPLICYQKLTKAGEWNRWNEALKMVAISEKLRSIHFIKIPRFELVRQRAKAMAGLGQLPEALRLFAACENQPGCPGWLHKAYSAGICYSGNRPDLALEFHLRSLQEKPSVGVYLDLCYHYARYLKDAAKARAALTEGEKEPLPDVVQYILPRCRGQVAYVEGDFASAERELRTSLQMLEQRRFMPYRESNLSLLKAFLCCAVAKQGRISEAAKIFNEARPYLEATDEAELLAECRAAIGDRSAQAPVHRSGVTRHPHQDSATL